MSTPQLARRERHALCDTALAIGEAAPTLCGDWVARDLVAHCWLREHRPLVGLGAAVGLSVLTDGALARARRTDFAVLVERLREPGPTPYALSPVERLANTLEFFVHHEDLRRAQPGWEPRDLGTDDQDVLWGQLGGIGRLLVRPAAVPVVLRRTDDASGTRTLRRGADPVTVSGLPSELALFLFGRAEHRGLQYDGPPDAVAALRGADLRA